jgi:hypothetical protein
MKQIYIAQENTDKTEGRGHMQMFAAFDNIEAAVEAVQDRGVMGVGTGEVSEWDVYSSFQDFLDEVNPTEKYVGQYPIISSRKVYGYRKDWKDEWNYGYIDNRDAPSKDPDYITYKTLQEKLKKKYQGRIPE